MDAHRDTVTVSIAGREIDMLRPTPDQLIGMTMAKSDQVADMIKIQIMTELFLSLLPDDDTREWFTLQMAVNGATFEELTTTIAALATAQQQTKPAAKKTTARKK